MKVLLCHNTYQETGGEDFAVHALKTLLVDRGHSVFFFNRHSDEIKSYSHWQKLKFFPQTLNSKAVYEDLRSLIKAKQPDVAHVHNVFPLLTPSLYNALADAKIPIVQTIHNYRLMCINSFFLRDGHVCELCKHGNFLPGIVHRCYKDNHLLSALYAATIGYHRQHGTFKRINHVIALTDFAAHKLVESGVFIPDRISVLGNFLFTPLPEIGQADQANPYFIFLGRLSQEKGLFTLLEAARQMTGAGLKIVGTGAMTSMIQDYIRQYNLRHVEMLGYITGAQKYELLRNALGCVIPSVWYENFPITALESAAVGTPVIASNLGSLGALVADQGFGLVFSPQNSNELGQHLNALAANPTKAMELGRQAAQLVRQRYTDESHYQNLLNIYNKVINENRVHY